MNSDDAMSGAYLGPQFSDEAIVAFLESHGHRYVQLPEAPLLDTVVSALDAGKVVGWFQGRMEFGPAPLALAQSLAIRGTPTCSEP